MLESNQRLADLISNLPYGGSFHERAIQVCPVSSQVGSLR